MGNNIQIFGRTFSDVSSITVNNTSSSAVKYVQEPIFEDITISQDYLVKQNTVVSNGIIFQTDETYPGTPVVIDNAKYANITNGDLGNYGIGIKIELNRTYHCIGELKIEWSTEEQEIYSIDSDFTPTSYSGAGEDLFFSWEGIGTSTQTFKSINLCLDSSAANGYGIFMRPGTVNVITKSGVLLDGSYYQISVTSDGFNTINLNLSSDPRFQAIYKSLAYRSVIASSAPGVSEWCNSLSNITLQQFAGQTFSGDFVFNNVSSISHYAFGSVFVYTEFGTLFWNCSFPNCTKIERGTFYQNKGIKEVYFQQCPSVGDYGFCECSNLTSISFPICTIIGSYAFSTCLKLTTANFPSCTTISDYAFHTCRSLSNISFPNCTTIRNSVFCYCSALTTASFPNCTSIGISAFYSCSTLTVASFPNCSFVDNGAFYDCYSLSNISFPSCITISTNAFRSCFALTEVNFPNCTSIGIYAFCDCSALTTVNFPNCTYIGGDAFYQCQNLLEVNFPNCTSIGLSAFYNCSALTAVSFPNCTSIGAHAFSSCSALTTVNFPSCTYIGANAFYICSALTVASFPNCTKIDNYAFYGCRNLSSLYLMGSSIPSIANYTFYQTPITTSTYLGYYGSIYVPASLLASYKTATYWSQYSSRMVGI